MSKRKTAAEVFGSGSSFHSRDGGCSDPGPSGATITLCYDDAMKESTHRLGMAVAAMLVLAACADHGPAPLGGRVAPTPRRIVVWLGNSS